MLRPALRTTVALILATVALAGCGGSGDDANGTGGGPSGTEALVHVDGTITASGDTITLTPKDGSAAMEFTLGPAVQKAQVMAIAASGSPARVTYRPSEDGIAAAVGSAPELGEGVESYEGTVVSVDDSKIVIDGADGERTFDISAADPGAFDAAHLTDHRDKGEPIRVYFKTDAPDTGIAYEDA